MASLSEFLKSIQIADYTRKFEKQGISDLDTLRALSKQELREIVNLGEATKIMQELSSTREGEGSSMEFRTSMESGDQVIPRANSRGSITSRNSILSIPGTPGTPGMHGLWKDEKKHMLLLDQIVEEAVATKTKQVANVCHESNLSAILPTNGMCWPIPFPHYVGLDFFPVTGQYNGNGEQVWRIELLGHTMKIEEDDRGQDGCREDGRRSIEFLYRFTIVDVPEDAGAEMMSSKDKWILALARGHVDVGAKAFVVRDHLEPLDGNLPSERIDLHILRWEFMLNSDNSMLIKKDAKFEGHKGILFRKAPKSIVPTLVPSTDVELEQKIMKAHKYMKDVTCLNLNVADKRRVEFSVVEGKVSGVDTVGESFDAEFKLMYSWDLSGEDLYSHIVKPDDWTPSWHPLAPIVLNSKEAGSVTVRAEPLKIQREDSSIKARRLWTLQGKFEEDFDLKNFPFDIQSFEVKLELQTDIDWNIISRKIEFSRIPTEFEIIGSGVLTKEEREYESNIPGQPRGLRTSIDFAARRSGWIYIKRIVAPQCVINALTMSVYTLPAVEERANRLNIVFVMLLVANSFYQEAAEMLPRIGYSTELGQYLLHSFYFIAAVACQVSLVHNESTDGITCRIIWVVFVLWHVATFYNLYRKIQQSELHVLSALPEAGEKRVKAKSSFEHLAESLPLLMKLRRTKTE